MFPTRWKAVCRATIALSLLVGFGPALTRVDAKVVSTDGKSIAFNSKRGGAYDIYVLNLKTGLMKQLTNVDERSDLTPLYKSTANCSHTSSGTGVVAARQFSATKGEIF